MKTKITVFTEVSIKPHHAGFGMYERGEVQFGPETSFGDLSDLEHAGELTPLEVALDDPEFREAGIENINGRIYNQPGRLYAKIYSDFYGTTVKYYGVEEREVDSDFFNT